MSTIRAIVAIDKAQLGGDDVMRVGRAKQVLPEIPQGTENVIEREIRTESRTVVIVKPGMFTLDEYKEAQEIVKHLESTLSARVASGELSGLEMLKLESELHAMKQEIRNRRPIMFRRTNKYTTERSKLKGVATITGGKLVQNASGAWVPVTA